MTESEGPFLVDTGNGLSIRYRGKNLYAPMSPIQSAERRAASVSIPANTVVFLPSPLLFHGVTALLAAIPEGVHLLCVEVDQKLMRLSLDHAPPSVLRDRRVTFLRTESVDEVLAALHRLGVGRYRRCVEVVLNGGSGIHRDRYATMLRALEYEVQSHWRNRMTLMHMSHLWIKNFISNIRAVAAGGNLANFKLHRPVAVAGAGESLEHAAPVLQSLREEYYLLAVDTAVGSLADLGLAPDAVIVLDAQSANLADFVGFDPEGATLLADITAYPECVRRFRGERWFFFSSFAELGLFSRARASGLLPTVVPPLGSVGVAALYCAMMITDAPVLFAGLDFSFRPGKSHARGAPAYVASMVNSNRLTPVDGYVRAADRPHRSVVDRAGSRVWTDTVLSGYSTALEFFLAGQDRVYDIGGAGITEAAPHLPDVHSTRQVLARYRTDESAPDGTNAPAPGRIDDVRRFLLEEASRISAGVDEALRALHTGLTDDAAPESLRRSVQELDYVYLHFPDWSEEPALSANFLKRFVEASETRKRWIERALIGL